MTSTNRYLIDLGILSSVENETHIYATDLNNTILCLNVTARRFFENTLMHNPDGLTIRELFQGNDQTIEQIEQENKLVCETEQVHLFYNRVNFGRSSWIDFITIKMPIYNRDNALAGVFGISHYIEKRSALPAYEMGLTKREIECIYLLLDGCSYKEIAKKMKISPRTVESYLANVKNKLACKGSADLFEKLKSAQLKTGIKDMINVTSTSIASNARSATIKKTNKNNK